MASVSLGAVHALDPDPFLVSIARATVIESLAQQGISVGSGATLDVTLAAPPSEAPAGAFATELRAEVTVRATLTAGGRTQSFEALGEGEAPVGGGASSAAEASRLARRRACEMAASRLAEALRAALE